MRLLVNGQFVEPEMASVSVLSPSFLYGYGVFETLRTHHGRIFALEAHLKRLAESAMAIDLALPYSMSEIVTMVEVLMKKRHSSEERIKIIGTVEAVILMAEDLHVDLSVYSGVPCMSLAQERALPPTKTLAYLDSYLSHQTAAKSGAYEALLVDREGYVTEASYANVFWFKGAALCTRADRVLPGITREQVLRLSPFTVQFGAHTVAELQTVDEVFLTQTTAGIVPVIQIDGVVIGSGSPGEKTRTLMKLFDQLLHTICTQ